MAIFRRGAECRGYEKSHFSTSISLISENVKYTLSYRIVNAAYAHDTLTRNRRKNRYQEAGSLLVSDASDMQFGTEFFGYQFLVTNRTVLYFRAGLWYRFCGTGFRRRFLVRVSWALLLKICTVFVQRRHTATFGWG